MKFINLSFLSNSRFLVSFFLFVFVTFLLTYVEMQKIVLFDLLERIEATEQCSK